MQSMSPKPATGTAAGAGELDVLPSLAALLRNVSDGERARPKDPFETRSAKLRLVNQQIAQLTHFLAIVRADCRGQRDEATRPA